MSAETIKTKGIVLRKTPYKETSLITSLYTPDSGRIDVLFRGELKLSKKKTPTVDIFRELELEYIDKESGLITPASFSLSEQFDNVALYPNLFSILCKISQFLLKNSFSNVPCPLSYKMLKNSLNNYCIGKTFFHAETLSKLTYLFEHGLLPESISPQKDKTNSSRFIKHLISYTTGEFEFPPKVNDEYWIKFESWINNLCKYHHLYLD